jgi:hypothetical protein
MTTAPLVAEPPAFVTVRVRLKVLVLPGLPLVLE